VKAVSGEDSLEFKLHINQGSFAEPRSAIHVTHSNNAEVGLYFFRPE